MTGAAPPFIYVQVTIAYGDPAQRRATRIVDVHEHGKTLRVYAISPAVLDDPAQTPEQQVRNATTQFLSLMSTGRYKEAVGWFEGDLAPLLAQKPDLDGDPGNDLELWGPLLEGVCSAGGGACLAQRRIIAAEQSGEAFSRSG